MARSCMQLYAAKFLTVYTLINKTGSFIYKSNSSLFTSNGSRDQTTIEKSQSHNH